MNQKTIEYYKWYIEMSNGNSYEVYTTLKEIPDTMTRITCLDIESKSITLNLTFAIYFKRLDGVYSKVAGKLVHL